MLTRKNKKLIYIVSSILIVLLMAIIIVSCVLFIRLKGEQYENVWLGPNSAYDISEDSVIVEKQPDKDFVILQLTDMQLWGNNKDNNAAFDIAEQTIEKSKPDLVVFTGDNVSGIGVPELLKKFISKIEEMAVKYDFLWAPIFGNHDNEMRATPNWSGDQYLKVSTENGGHCLFRKGPTNLGDQYGYLLGNYVINIKEGDSIVQSLYMLDNSTYAKYEKSVYEYSQNKYGRSHSERPFPYSQIEWCKWQANNINRIAGEAVPSLFFTHCAPYEMGNAIFKYVAGKDEKLNTDDDMKKQDEEGYWTLPNEYQLLDSKQIKNIDGRFAYVPGYALYNTGMVDSMKPLGLQGWFVGHDHENDVIFEYDNIIYGYGLKAGPSPKPWNNSYYFGGTTITVKKDGSFIPEHIRIMKASDYWAN